MKPAAGRKYRVATWWTRHVANPAFALVAGRLPGTALLETTGRRTGRPHRVPVTGRRDGDVFRFVSEHGTRADYVRNLVANPAVRIRLSGRWLDATARIDDVPARSNVVERLFLRLVGTGSTPVRVDVR